MSKIKLESEYDDLDKYKNNFEDIFYYKKNTKTYHNPHGPAVIWKSGHKEYYIENKLHRLDGPAIIWPDGHIGYFINNKRFTEEEFEIHPERLKYLGKEYLICLK